MTAVLRYPSIPVGHSVTGAALAVHNFRFTPLSCSCATTWNTIAFLLNLQTSYSYLK